MPPPNASEAMARLRESRGEKWTVYPEDVIPVWVADMDLDIAPPIKAALARMLERPDLGYPIHPRPTQLPTRLAERLAARFGWQIEPRRVELITDVVQGIFVSLAQWAEPGEGVVIQTPIYPPFLGAVREMKRRIVENPLAADAGGYAVDLDGLRAACDAGTRMILLCNPHNPSGRAFTRAELEGIAAIAEERDLVVVSDEIHAELVFSGAKHIPFASLAPEVEARTVTLYSASKAFNIAGLRCAAAIFGSDTLRRRFLELPRHLRGGLGTMGLEATRVAWTESDTWLAETLALLEENRDFLVRRVRETLPGVVCHSPEATYLAWLDCRSLGLEPSPYDFFLDRARVATSDGAAFGTPGEGFVRVNFATQRPILSEALERMAKSLEQRA